MTIYELLISNRSVIEILDNSAVNVSDVRYIELYKEYCKMINEGHKKTYIISYLTEEYQVNERTVYRIINKFDKEIEV